MTFSILIISTSFCKRNFHYALQMFTHFFLRKKEKANNLMAPLYEHIQIAIPIWFSPGSELFHLSYKKHESTPSL